MQAGRREARGEEGDETNLPRRKRNGMATTATAPAKIKEPVPFNSICFSK
jgi:hypothetical protein